MGCDASGAMNLIATLIFFLSRISPKFIGLCCRYFCVWGVCAFFLFVLEPVLEHSLRWFVHQ